MTTITQTTEVELWGVVYFEDDGPIARAELLHAADYHDAADQALDVADGGEFQLFEEDSIIGPQASAFNRVLFAPALSLHNMPPVGNTAGA